MAEHWNRVVARLNDLGELHWAFASAMFLQASALVAVLFVADLILLRRLRASLRYALWSLVLVKLLLPVSLASPVSLSRWVGDSLTLPSLPADVPHGVRIAPPGRVRAAEPRPFARATNHPAASQPFVQGDGERPSVDASPFVSPSPRRPALPLASPNEQSRPLARPTWRAWLLLAWLGGATAFAACVAVRIRRVRRLLAESGGAPAEHRERLDACLRDAGMRQGRIALRVTDRLASPAICGLMRATILLPRGLAGRLDDEALRLVFLHEILHWRRFDLQVNALQTLLQVIYFYNPFVWVANALLRRAREQAVDEAVLALSASPRQKYGETLVEIAALGSRRADLALRLVGVVESRRALAGRLARILTRPVPRTAKLGATGLTAVLLSGLFLLPMAGGQPAASPVASPESPPPSEETPADENSIPTEAAPSTGSISGRVLRQDGTPAAGAEVDLLLPPRDGTYVWPLPLKRTTADAEGRFSFDALGPGQHRVWAVDVKQTSRTGRLRGEKIDVPPAGGATDPVELKLHDGVTVTVIMKDRATGKPIPGAVARPGWNDLERDFAADEEGRAVVQPLTPERWFIEALAEGYAKESRFLNLENGLDAETEFRLGPGVAIEGVVRGPDGTPVHGAGISARRAGEGEQFDYQKTDRLGRYRVSSVPRDVPFEISVSKDGYSDAELTVAATAGDRTADVTLAPAGGPASPTDVTLSPRPHGGSITGIVVGPDGRPVAGAELVNEGRSTRDVRKGTTDATGRFRLEDLFAGSTGPDVVVGAKGFAPRRLPIVPGPADAPAEIRIELEPGHRIAGRVVDEDGRPIEGVTVYFAGGRRAFSTGGKGETDADGRFSFDSLPADSPFEFVKRGYSAIEDKELPLDGDDPVTVVMSPQGVIRGRAVDAATGAPLRTVNVRITFSPQARPGEPSTGLSSDLVDPGQTFQSPDGKFELRELTAGMPLQVTVAAEGYERHVTERVEARKPKEAETVDFPLTPEDPATFTTYAGRLLDSDGKPAVGAEVRLVAAADRDPIDRHGFPFNWAMIQTGQVEQRPNVLRFEKAATDADGRFSFDRIPKDSEVELFWWGDGLAPGRYDHLEKLGEDERKDVRIDLPKPARIIGQVDRDAFPLAGRVRLSPNDSEIDDATAEIRPDGTYEVDGLAPGAYSVNLMSRPEPVPGEPGAVTLKTLVTQEVTVSAGEEWTVDFVPDEPNE